MMSDQEFSRQCARLARLSERELVGPYAGEFTIHSARDLFDRLATFDNGQWAFRGQDADFRLEPTIERSALKGFWNVQESWAFEEFKKRAKLHSRELSEMPSDCLAWLATMRHFGGPTRLLDWSKDPHVAAFFAFSDAATNKASAVWAINEAAIAEEANRLLSEPDCQTRPPLSFDDGGHFAATFFRSTWPPVVMPVEPSHPCGRQKAQKGIFLCPNATHWEYDFETCLKNVLQSGMDRKERWLYKLKIMPGSRDEVLTELERKGISYESLFPGMDGLGKSLKVDVSLRSDYFGYYYPTEVDVATT